MVSFPQTTTTKKSLPFLPLTYNNGESETSALRLVLSLFPDWETTEGKVHFDRFKDGITNTLLKITKRRPSYTQEQIDEEAVLMRAYGNNTDLLIDRERETASHLLLSQRGLAPPLLARFKNGLLYRFIRGRPCTSTDLTKQPIWRGVAQRIGQWHALLPCISDSTDRELIVAPSLLGVDREEKSVHDLEKIKNACPGKSTPNLWSVMQTWVLNLPVQTAAERERKAQLQIELERSIKELGNIPGLGKDGFVFGHCDLLSGNVIIEPRRPGASGRPETETVSFIDYEYATPSPAAFDIANHLAEWGGFECDYTVLPTKSQRRDFLTTYLRSYRLHHDSTPSAPLEEEVERLFKDVDIFRGMPGLYWGIWALIQATISQIDFDYASYAETRLGEYYAWRAELDGSRERSGQEMPLREQRWAEE